LYSIWSEAEALSNQDGTVIPDEIARPGADVGTAGTRKSSHSSPCVSSGLSSIRGWGSFSISFIEPFQSIRPSLWELQLGTLYAGIVAQSQNSPREVSGLSTLGGADDLVQGLTEGRLGRKTKPGSVVSGQRKLAGIVAEQLACLAENVCNELQLLGGERN
jgi:hypothetical protein